MELVFEGNGSYIIYPLMLIKLSRGAGVRGFIIPVVLWFSRGGGLAKIIWIREGFSVSENTKERKILKS